MANAKLTQHDLVIDGRQITVSSQHVAQATLRLTWTLPPNPLAFDGVVVLLSESKFTPDNFPIDGTRYVGSTNFAAPADTINGAQVITAFYGYFGDATNQTTVDVSGIDSNKVYYVSVHAASNILQYFTPGVQSYPLDNAPTDRRSDTYAGSIPSANVPPTNPTSGQAYFDPSTNSVLIWNAASAAWVQTNNKTVPVGPAPLVNSNAVFFNSIDSRLKVFISGLWIVCNSTNTRVKFGGSYVPLGVVHDSLVTTATPGDIAYRILPIPLTGANTLELFLFTLGQWLKFSKDLVQFETSPGVWTNVALSTPLHGMADPEIPLIGDFFYSTTTKSLLAWSGSEWVKADTEDEGTVASDKVGIGTDGTYDDRLNLTKILKSQLGWPGVCVELSEDQFNIAIDNALDTFRQRADNAYLHRHLVMTLNNRQQSYYLNDPRAKTDRVVNVLNIHRVNMLGAGSLSTDGAVFAQPYFQSLFNGASIDLVAMHLSAQLSETFEKMFAGNLVFTWDEASRQLQIHRKIGQNEERVILEVVMERTEQELLQDRWCKQWLQGWAMAELKETLGMIRTKYGSVAGPNGGLTLNGDMLISEARQDFDDLQRQINDFEVGNGGVNFGNTSILIM